MSVEYTFGTYDEDSDLPSISEFEVRFMPLDLVAHWRRCGMTADFLAYFLSHAFRNPDSALGTLSTVINELLENAVKFSADKRVPVVLSLSHFGEVIGITATNTCRDAHAERFAGFLERLRTEDIDDLFVSQIEHNAESAQGESGLGIITMVKDYGASLAVRITPAEGGEGHDVVVRVVLNAEELDRA
ncbi:MAG: hypothetical protein H6734_11500 [Alphaproteobacteria bacterium]|nr:hypothetical protein [Alphaproteobacteria bacterium]